jgi:hypothetical protein
LPETTENLPNSTWLIPKAEKRSDFKGNFLLYMACVRHLALHVNKIAGVIENYFQV